MGKKDLAEIGKPYTALGIKWKRRLQRRPPEVCSMMIALNLINSYKKEIHYE